MHGLAPVALVQGGGVHVPAAEQVSPEGQSAAVAQSWAEPVGQVA